MCSLEINDHNDVTIGLVGLTQIQISNNGEVSIKRYLNKATYRDLLHSSNLDNVYQVVVSLIGGIKNQQDVILDNLIYEKIHLFKRDSILAISGDKGVVLYRDGIESQGERILLDYQITGFEIDFEGGIWFSTLFNGVLYIPNYELKKIETLKNQSNHIHAILPIKDGLVFCFGKGDNFYKLDSKQTGLLKFNSGIEYKELNLSKRNCLKFENPVFFQDVFMSTTSLLKIDSSKILFSLDKMGMVLMDTSDTLPLNYMSQNYETHRNYYEDIWYKIGASYYSPKYSVLCKQIEKYQFKVLKLFKDSRGTIWMGTLNGLFTFNLDQKKSVRVNRFPSFQNYRIQDIIESFDSSLFFATKANGIFMVKNDSVSQLNVLNGLMSNTVHQLVYDEDKNQIWFSTNTGIGVLRYSSTKGWVPFPVIDKYDGIQNTDIRQLLFFNNNLYFANNTGVGRIKKSNMNLASPPPFFYITGLSVNTKLIREFTNLSFPYDSNNIQINYQAIGYNSQNSFTYWYRLNNGKRDWQSTTNSNITLSSLPPDNYVIQIKATNVDGIDSEIKSISFKINPALWMTWWFKVIIICIAVFFGYRISIRTIRNYKSQAKLQGIINELQVVSLQSKMNPHFIFNSLNSIQNYILKSETEQANHYLLEFSKLIRIILQNSDSTTIELDREIEILQMYVELERKRLRNDFQFIVDIDDRVDRLNCLIPSLLIQPYVENSIWHGKVYSNPNGKIKISVKRENDILYFEITDNGMGVKNAMASKLHSSTIQHKSIATKINNKRVQLLSKLHDQMSEVKITELNPNLSSNKFVGTCVTFSIPYKVKSTINE